MWGDHLQLTFLYPLKNKEIINKVIFVDLTYTDFDILRSQNGQVKKVMPFPGCAKNVTAPYCKD